MEDPALPPENDVQVVESVKVENVSNILPPQGQNGADTDVHAQNDDPLNLKNSMPAAELEAGIASDVEASMDSVESPIASPKAEKKKKGKDPSSWSDEKLLKKLRRIAEIKKDRDGLVHSIFVDGAFVSMIFSSCLGCI
jgi:hypothetical protein